MSKKRVEAGAAKADLPSMQTETLFDDAGLAPVADAIARMVATPEDPPTLETLAAELGYSPFHFQRLFKRGVGVSPKRFAQALRLGPARALLTSDTPVLSASLDVGMSGPSRLHDLFVACEAVTPGDVRRRGRGLEIKWGVHASPFGRVLLAETPIGVCWLSFGTDETIEAMFGELHATYAQATYRRDDEATAKTAAAIFGPDRTRISLDLHGTNFQIKVWQALLAIPAGNTVSYGELAGRIGNKAASRAVGTAVGSNPISLLIPCHRVIQASGAVHHYRWGTPTKRALLAWERARFDTADAA
ncbi:MAG: 6-O-methylguanine methyltransferase [Rhodospirillales bacterium]|jgi:AraC family transcriptional regulator of adaptative response/methylated-DNA-[protein]-cysteine methyltransferase|nr:6-O-methylguanine methyltransferase [Rhodospirillales bacterium]